MKNKNIVVRMSESDISALEDILEFYKTKNISDGSFKSKSSSSIIRSLIHHHQKVITRSDPTHRDCLGLIACYYPQLIKDLETALAINK